MSCDDSHGYLLPLGYVAHSRAYLYPATYPILRQGCLSDARAIMTILMQSYEVEIKALLGSVERAEALRDALKAVDPECAIASHNKQLNHYFEGGTLEKLAETVSAHLSEESRAKLADLAGRAKEFSVRTREKDNA